MTDRKFQEQIDNACSAEGWDQGNDSHAPTDQAMGIGASTVKEKCNAATNDAKEGV